jgi:hypothetical protein
MRFECLNGLDLLHEHQLARDRLPRGLQLKRVDPGAHALAVLVAAITLDCKRGPGSSE